MLSPFTAKAMDSSIANGTTTATATSDHEIERRMHLVTEASRVIDLTEISHVQRSFASSDDDDDDDHDDDENYHLGRNSIFFDVDSTNSLTTSLLRQQHQQNGDSDNVTPVRRSGTRPQNPVLEIIMQNGIVIKMKADSCEACDAWVHHLANLIVYWRAYKEARLNVNAQHDFGDVFEEEFRYGITHKEKGSEFNKLPQVDTRIWSICCFEQCRDIVKTGVMYFQPRSRGTFSQKIFVLTANGWLIYYNIYDRAAVTCQPLLAAVHDRKDAVDISSCYVYSSLSPRRPARIFPDGIAAADVKDDSLFSLWKPQTRRVFSPSRQRITVYKHNRKFFQEEGETWQFLAKNRHEKEEWVWAFNVVIERLLRGK
ncbi:hypothetical protein BDB00DRAFT_137271 [Zychaea mexicana]|uniref:uncharacterized protein n=1 Tax=Zychaea mexicana TaxID=64656 RepID=UPI0022FF2A43|nr:uncharacterized protein BDB00DRAFT_137271 [Zychaea mexicana]KAI9496222.1 hypothetical protein BDB00DRAFT_137271 [Zychaea mexicana]